MNNGTYISWDIFSSLIQFTDILWHAELSPGFYSTTILSTLQVFSNNCILCFLLVACLIFFSLFSFFPTWTELQVIGSISFSLLHNSFVLPFSNNCSWKLWQPCLEVKELSRFYTEENLCLLDVLHTNCSAVFL